MKVFITGGAGLLGSELMRRKPRNCQAMFSYHENKLIPTGCSRKYIQIDICNKQDTIKKISSFNPEVIIHTAAIGSPDICEKNPQKAQEVNVLGTRNIIEIAEEIGAKIYFTSTNQVFSGNTPPYSEQSNPDPINVYGKSKRQSELDLLKYSKFKTIVRLMTMYGWNNPAGYVNTATWVIDKLSKGTPLKVVDDIYNNFLWVGQAANMIWELVLKKVHVPIIHLAGADTVNRYDFAVKVARIFKLDEHLIEPVHKSYFHDEAPRPLNTVYDISLMSRILKSKIYTITEGLNDMYFTRIKAKWSVKKNEKI